MGVVEWEWRGAAVAVVNDEQYFRAVARERVLYCVGDCVQLASGEVAVILALWAPRHEAAQPSPKMAEVRFFQSAAQAQQRSSSGDARASKTNEKVFESDRVEEVAVSAFERKVTVAGPGDSSEAEFRAVGMQYVKSMRVAALDTSETRLQRSRKLGRRVRLVPDDDVEASGGLHLPRAGVKRRREAPAARVGPGDGCASRAAVSATVEKLQRACEELQLSSLPRVMTGREDERDEIYAALRSSIEQQSAGGPIYISGLPGAGKTSIVKEVIRTLEAQRDARALRHFAWVEVNGLQMPRPDVAYSVLWEALHRPDGAAPPQPLPVRKAMSAARLCEQLQRELQTENAARPLLLVLLDEMDFMLAGKNQVLYNLLEWQTVATAKLVLVGIANTMDLPERLPMKIRSRLGGHRITFPAYTRAQLERIMQQRLSQLRVFSDEAIQLCAKSLAHQSGDVRQALSLCRKAAELCVQRLAPGADADADAAAAAVRTDECFVTAQDLQRAQQAVSVSAPMSRLRACSKFECVFLVALRMQVRSGGEGRAGASASDSDSGEMDAVIERFAILCKTHAFLPIPRLRGLLWICDELERSGLIRQITSRSSRYPRLELRCSHQELQDVFLTHPIGMQLIT